MRLNYSFLFVIFTVFCLYATSTHANSEGVSLDSFFSQHQVTPDSDDYEKLLDLAVQKVMVGVRIQLQINKKLYHGFTCDKFLFLVSESTLDIVGVTILAPTENAGNWDKKTMKNKVKSTETLVKILLRRCTSTR
ncbi:uncharacterized protein EV420DRAFT_1493664 [Desarmillaria tabescens]|uniref:Uncharacterized protein n=1 Tax=Armillaria tabescens TaxID=1929756 RepID=A0AA39NPA6_ARMTA|nr:uncharacterized protein EV420DRAFT_1493664 [Desarmillaria tabescens]KAK0469308.1 hypothetical protein EV420DRAFT_1493664 [Desarmillaria tabescens]